MTNCQQDNALARGKTNSQWDKRNNSWHDNNVRYVRLMFEHRWSSPQSTVHSPVAWNVATMATFISQNSFIRKTYVCWVRWCMSYASNGMCLGLPCKMFVRDVAQLNKRLRKQTCKRKFIERNLLNATEKLLALASWSRLETPAMLKQFSNEISHNLDT